MPHLVLCWHLATPSMTSNRRAYDYLRPTRSKMKDSRSDTPLPPLKLLVRFVGSGRHEQEQKSREGERKGGGWEHW